LGSFGCMCHDTKLDFKIHLHGYAARYAKNRIWGENQKVEADSQNLRPDGDGIILSFRSNQLFSIRRWVWQWADEAYPLAPKELVDDWKERLEKVNKMAIK
ncbi:MAG: WYL domain-containing protein, partial [Treponema sp.]|nr:WYL domain-containing protein [Treponema sp.]